MLVGVGAAFFISAAPAVALPTGSLQPVAGPAGCIGATDLAGTCTVGRALDLPAAVTVSVRDQSAYVASFFSDAVAVFRRETTGSLSQLPGPAGCVSATGEGGTCASARALDGAASATVSPDGTYVYVASRVSQAVAVFARDLTTGALTQLAGTQGCVSETGSEGCADAPLPLGGANSVAVSPDGAHLYVGSFVGDVISVFSRGADGSLTQTSCISQTGEGGCSDGRSLQQVFTVATSPDGRNVYATAWGSDTLVVFGRDSTTGTLTQLPEVAGCISQTGAEGCTDGSGLDATHDVKVSPDAKHVYVASNESDAITIYSRATSGELSFKSCMSHLGAEGCVPAAGIDGVQGLDISADGTSVHTASVASSAVASFGRNAKTGALKQFEGTAGCVSETGTEGACQDGRGLLAAAWVALSPDGKLSYVAGAASDAVTSYIRTTTRGRGK